MLPGAARKKAIGKLEREYPSVYNDYLADKRQFEASNEFARASDRFSLTARGKVNTYSLFAELCLKLIGLRGRAGIIVPTGIATDASTAPFFGHLIEARLLFSLHDFQTGLGFFDRIGHARFKFCLLTMGEGGTAEPDFSFFSRTLDEFADRRRHFRLSSSAIQAINPNTRTAPIFRTETDAQLTAKVHARVPVLLNESLGADGNPWGIEFRQGLFNMTSDSGRFRTASQLHAEGYRREGVNWVVGTVGDAQRSQVMPESARGGGASSTSHNGAATREIGRFVPLCEAKMIHQFDHRWATYEVDDERSRDATSDEKRRPAFEVMPRYWVPESEVDAVLSSRGWTRSWLMGWRDICRSTDERTVISAVFPRAGVGNNLPLMLFRHSTPEKLAALIGCLSSLTCDFFARHKVGGAHLNFFIYQQLAVLPPCAYTAADLGFITPRFLELTYTSYSMAPFAHDLGYDGPPFGWDEDRRALLRAELDAFYARAYGIARDELRFILDPADVKGADYPSETFRVLKNNEIKRYGEYRTARLVLDAFDRIEIGELA